MNLLLNTPALNVYEHMALDEQEVRVRANEVTLRFYHWVSGPAVTFGYAQFIHEVRRALQERHFSGLYARRPTGGGVVFHEDDLTFSLVFTSSLRPTEIYKKLHAFILHSLAEKGQGGQLFNAHLPPSAYAPSVEHRANACFVRPVENDLLSSTGEKMLGGAIRRFGNTVLYQGSLQLPKARTNPHYKRAIVEAVRAFLAVDLCPSACAEELLNSARQLAQAQYQTQVWTEKF